MKAYAIAGKRGGANIKQAAFADRMGWHVATMRDVEQGRVSIADEEYERLNATLNEMIAESARLVPSEEKEEVAA